MTMLKRAVHFAHNEKVSRVDRDRERDRDRDRDRARARARDRDRARDRARARAKDRERERDRAVSCKGLLLHGRLAFARWFLYLAQDSEMYRYVMCARMHVSMQSPDSNNKDIVNEVLRPLYGNPKNPS